MERNKKEIDVVAELNSLIQLDFDASKSYEVAIGHLDTKDIEVKEDLEIFRRDHLRHIDDLKIVIRALGGDAKEPSRDVKGVLLEGMTLLRSVTGTIGALRAIRMNEKLTNKTYDKAFSMDLPTSAHGVVTRNLEDERRHLAAIEAHISRMSQGEPEREEDETGDELLDLHPGAPI